MHLHLLDMGLGELAKAARPLISETMSHFWPETILTGGFIIAIILDLFIRKSSNKKAVGYFALIVLAAAFVTSWYQWVPFIKGDWEGGRMIFPYFQTLVPQFGMAVVDNFAVFFKLVISLAAIFVVLMSLL